MTPHIYAGLSEWHRQNIVNKGRNPFTEKDKQIIFEAACNVMNINKNELQSKSRKRECVYARKLVAFALREKHMLSLPKCAKITKQNHSTILYHIRDINNLIQINDLLIKNKLIEFDMELKRLSL